MRCSLVRSGRLLGRKKFRLYMRGCTVFQAFCSSTIRLTAIMGAESVSIIRVAVLTCLYNLRVNERSRDDAAINVLPPYQTNYQLRALLTNLRPDKVLTERPTTSAIVNTMNGIVLMAGLEVINAFTVVVRAETFPHHITTATTLLTTSLSLKSCPLLSLLFSSRSVSGVSTFSTASCWPP